VTGGGLNKSKILGKKYDLNIQEIEP